MSSTNAYFDYGGTTREQLINEADLEIRAILGHGGPGGIQPKVIEFLENMKTPADGVCKIPKSNPKMIELNSAYDNYFKSQNVEIPLDFRALSGKFDFYWWERALTFNQGSKRPYTQIRFHVKLNPGEAYPDRIPVAHEVLPRDLSMEIAKIGNKVDFNLSPTAKLDIEAGIKGVNVPTGIAFVNGKLSATAGLAAKLGIESTLKIALEQSIRKIIVKAWNTGTDEMGWEIFGASQIAALKPNFIMIVRVPKSVDTLIIQERLDYSLKLDIPQAILDIWGRLSENVRKAIAKGTPDHEKPDNPCTIALRSV